MPFLGARASAGEMPGPLCPACFAMWRAYGDGPPVRALIAPVGPSPAPYQRPQRGSVLDERHVGTDDLPLEKTQVQARGTGRRTWERNVSPDAERAMSIDAVTGTRTGTGAGADTDIEVSR